VFFFNVLLFASFIVAIFYNPQFFVLNISFSLCEMACTLLLLKILVELIFLLPVAQFYDKKKMLWYFPLMQPFHILYTIIAGWLGKFGKYKWKGREVE